MPARGRKPVSTPTLGAMQESTEILRRASPGLAKALDQRFRDGQQSILATLEREIYSGEDPLRVISTLCQREHQ